MLYSPPYMHIPDGYLSPIVSLTLFVLTLPFWYRGIQKMRQAINARSLPVIALLAAFSFVIMLFNVPLPGGTTGHAVAGALVAIILGPEVATIAISIALIIQAFFFGDGGILAIGANCFNMAVVLPYVSYALYRAISRKSLITSRRRLVGAAVGAWIGLNMSAFFTAFEFGIQPALFHTADGTPLYAPYPLSVAIPAMLIPHMLIASAVEAIVTVLIVAYLQRANQPLLELVDKPEMVAASGRPLRLRWLYVLLAVALVAAPIGLLAPGTAWGEWNSNQFAQLGLKFVPEGLRQLEGLWSAPLAGYNVAALGNANAGYFLSAVVGIVVIAVVVWLLTAVIITRKPKASSAGKSNS